MHFLILLLLLHVLVLACICAHVQAIDDNSTSTWTNSTGTSNPDPTETAKILSAYLGVVDISFPAAFSVISGCPQEEGDDGMPLVFSVPVDNRTLNPSKFLITTTNQSQFIPTCATLNPATDPDELHTVLLTGNFATSTNLPVRVQLVGDVFSLPNEGSNERLNLQGLFIDNITLFSAGASLVQANLLTRNSTLQIQTIWQGGVTGSSRADLNEEDLSKFVIMHEQQSQDGSITTTSYSPIDFDDMDGDNYLNLVLPPELVQVLQNSVAEDHITKPSLRVEVAAGTAFDPTNNPNPQTQIAVNVPAKYIRDFSEADDSSSAVYPLFNAKFHGYKRFILWFCILGLLF